MIEPVARTATPSSRDPLRTPISLVAGLRNRERRAWERLVELYYPLIFNWCVRGGLQPEDAADVVQEVFRAVSSGVGALRYRATGDSFRGWLRGITRHKVQDFWRKRRGITTAAGGSEALAQLTAAPDPLAGESASADESELSDAAMLTRRALELIKPEFEERTWQAFWRVTVDEQSPNDVAAALNISPNAVYKAKARVLQRLRLELGELER